MTRTKHLLGRRGPWALYAFEITTSQYAVSVWYVYNGEAPRPLSSMAATRAEDLNRAYHRTYLATRTPAEVCDLYTLLDEGDSALSLLETQTNGETHV